METTFSQPSNPKRQSLTPEGFENSNSVQTVSDNTALKTISEFTAEYANYKDLNNKLENLRAQLQTALELEHSTIPPYLCALYSIKPGTNVVASEIIKSVVLEEMLHMVMVANLLNAVNGKPMIGQQEKVGDKFIPSYPTSLPGNVDPNFKIGLTYFSKGTIDTFCTIEHPDGGFNMPHQDGKNAKIYNSIGEFYIDLAKNILVLEGAANANGQTIFKGDQENQVPAEHYYGAGGKLITVSNWHDAFAVIAEIVGQGEGSLGSIFSGGADTKDDTDGQIFAGTVEEYAHYFRFKEVLFGQYYAPTDSIKDKRPDDVNPTGRPFEVDWDAVCKMKPNPKMEDYKDSKELYDKMFEFNSTYSALLDNIHEACNGNPEKLKDGIGLMYAVRYKAVELMNIPVGDGFMAGPSFEYVEAGKRPITQ